LYVALICAALAGCHGARDEARALVSAVDRFRQASNDDKPALADALDKVPCTDEAVCAAKASCTKSADATARGLRLQKEVTEGLGKVEAGAPGEDAHALGEKWSEAGRKLDEGFRALEDCDGKVERLRAEYGN
jgi:hypothetical protein